MKQHLYEPTIFLRDGKEWIKGFTMERPIKSEEQGEGIRLDYERCLEQFLASAVEYPVCEGSCLPIKDEIRKSLAHPAGQEWCDMLEKGIRIDELADRLEVVDVPIHGNKFDSSVRIEKQIRLRPEVKEESQDLSRLDMTDFINKWTSDRGYTNIPRSRFDEFIKDFTKQFTIKRNQ